MLAGVELDQTARSINVVAGLGGAWTRVLWWLLVVVDVVVVALFAFTAATDPSHVLEGEGVDSENFQGLVPIAIVVALRSMVLAAERRLLPVARGLVLASWLVSLVGFYYLGRWVYQYAYRRWLDVVLGGTVGYALVGVAGVGLAALIYNLSRIRSAGPAREPPPGERPTNDATATADQMPDTPGRVAAQRRQLTKESLLSLVGVFVGVTGLVMGVTDIRRLGVAVLVGAVAVAGIALLLRRRTG